MKVNPYVGAAAGAIGAVLIAKHAFKAQGALPMVLVGIAGAYLGSHLANRTQQTSAFAGIDRAGYVGRSKPNGNGVHLQFNPAIGKMMPVGTITNVESTEKAWEGGLGSDALNPQIRGLDLDVYQELDI